MYGPRSQPWNGVKKIMVEMIQNKVLLSMELEKKKEYIHVKDAARMSVDLVSDDYLQAVTLTGLQVLTQRELLR